MLVACWRSAPEAAPPVAAPPEPPAPAPIERLIPYPAGPSVDIAPRYVVPTDEERCAVFTDYVVIQRPILDLRDAWATRVRRSTGHVSADCKWDGEILFQQQCKGFAAAMWDRFLLTDEGDQAFHTLHAWDVPAGKELWREPFDGSVTMPGAGILAYEVPIAAPARLRDLDACDAAIDAEWDAIHDAHVADNDLSFPAPYPTCDPSDWDSCNFVFRVRRLHTVGRDEGDVGEWTGETASCAWSR
jgi:hypothetical protein